MGPGQFFAAWVRSAIYSLSLNLENFPKKCQIFQFFLFGSKKYLRVRSKSSRVKGGLASYLLRVGSELISTIYSYPLLWLVANVAIPFPNMFG